MACCMRSRGDDHSRDIAIEAFELPSPLPQWPPGIRVSPLAVRQDFWRFYVFMVSVFLQARALVWGR